MIEQAHAMPHLVEACPSFRATWEAHRDAYGNEELTYVAGGLLARHLLALFKADERANFPAICAAIEDLHTNGSAWVQTFATVGILEAIQHVWIKAGIDPQQFSGHLGPESLKHWDGLNTFWDRAER